MIPKRGLAEEVSCNCPFSKISRAYSVLLGWREVGSALASKFPVSNGSAVVECQHGGLRPALRDIRLVPFNDAEARTALLHGSSSCSH
jgi:hypothetical protein